MVEREWAVIARKLKSVYPKLFTERAELVSWYESLKSYDATAVATAANKWISANRWAPKISEIVDLIPVITAADWMMISQIYHDCGKVAGLPSKKEYLARFSEDERGKLEHYLQSGLRWDERVSQR